MKVLVVEDNTGLSENICSYLGGEGYLCTPVYDLPGAREKMGVYTYDLVILDLMLPSGNGLDLLRFLKAEGAASGVLILSAKDSVDDRVLGLDLGADDYLTKPFHLPELHARLRAIYRRRKLNGQDLVQFEELTVDVQTYEARVNDQLLVLTRKEFELLLYMLTNQGRVLTKQSIAEHLWGRLYGRLRQL